MAVIEKKDIPRFVRNCFEEAKRANAKNRSEEIRRLKMYVGDQWDEAELKKRQASNRPTPKFNRLKPAVDQIEGDIRLNPPGPQCNPVSGSQGDKDTADLIEGLIRETEYRSNATTAYATAGKYVAASGVSYIELSTEFASDISFEQRLRIDSVEDPNQVFFDPTARRANREDSTWAGKLKMYSKAEYMMNFGSTRKVLKKGPGNMVGWIQDAMGIPGELAQIKEWTGGGEGPFFVAEFYLVEVKMVKLRLYSDNVARFDDEDSEGATPVQREDGSSERDVPRRTIKKYVVDALEILDETEWPGTLIPIFPVLGPEVYIDGKLHRLSLISGAMDAQAALNYALASAIEIAGLIPRSPWIGPAGTFDDARWETANSEAWAYLEYTPVLIPDPAGGSQLAAPPTRNTWEASLQWCLALATYLSDTIKATTGIFDPSLGAQKGDQSGKAIEQLRSESTTGNFSYADNLHRAISAMYQQMCVIFPKIYSGQRAVTIVKPDTSHEQQLINQLFPIEHQGKKGPNLMLGQFSVRAKAGPSFDTRQEAAIEALSEFFKVDPTTLQVPGVAAHYLRLIGQGNPTVEGMADLLDPQGTQDMKPEQLAGKLAQAQAIIQKLQMQNNQLAQAIASKLPDIALRDKINLRDNITKIHVAEVNASKDADRQAAEIQAEQMAQVLDMAHEAAINTAEAQHGADQQTQQQAADQEEPVGAE